MNKIAIVAASMLFAGAASAADMAVPVKAVVAPAPATPVWDIAFGGGLTSDYTFRGISQTNGNPAIQGYAELQLFDWFYAGVWASNVSFLDSGSAEMDWSAGLRHTWSGLTLDAGFVGYTYPGSSADTNLNYWEVYFKPTYAVNDWLTVGANLFYTTDYAASGTTGTFLSGTLKVTGPTLAAIPAFGAGFGTYASGEFGYQWLDSKYYTASFANILGTTYTQTISGYSYWNAGVGLTYKVATLDLRYYGSDLNADQCTMLIANSSSCGNRYIATLSFATSLNAFK